MTYAQGLKKATSLCFCGKLDADSLHMLKQAGIEAAELSFGFDYYMNRLDFARNWEKCAEIAQQAGVELWSIHLPFSRTLDISNTKDEFRSITMYTNRTLIEAAGKAGIKVAVLHPSSEPIDDEARPERLRRSRESIIQLREACEAAGMKLAVENLPRTCLCNRASEMIELLRGTGAGVVFDTNHSLIDENVSFLSQLIDAGLEIITLHISDYDFIDERHRLPGDGLNNWTGILAQLERCHYSGPLMYEVPRQPKEREAISVEQLSQNMSDLAAGKIK